MLQTLLEQVKNMIFSDPTTPHQPGHDPSGLIGRIEGLFSQQGQQGQQGDYQVRPSSQDPMGDPADAGFGGNVRPASQDPLGDPADEGRTR